VFERENPFTGFKNSFEEGVRKLDEGDLISAILLFEEAVYISFCFVYKDVVLLNVDSFMKQLLLTGY